MTTYSANVAANTEETAMVKTLNTTDGDSLFMVVKAPLTDVYPLGGSTPTRPTSGQQWPRPLT